MKKTLIFGLMFLLLISCVLAIQPTQQYNKIYLQPFYRVSLSANTNVTYTVDVNPIDKISSVSSAIISFNLQANGQTQAYTLWVNGQSCNNPTYNIATAFSTTGQLQFYFDCSNIITKPGNYTVTLKSDTNTGAVSGWLDLTYMNNPIRDMNVYGTEYIPNENGTIFINLITNQNLASSLCYIDIFYPNKTYFYSGPLTQSLSNLALFYYDFVVPSNLGVYMAASTCTQPLVTQNQVRFFNNVSNLNVLVNYTNTTQRTYSFGSLTTRTCSPMWTDSQAQVFRLNNITGIGVYLASGASRSSTLEMEFWRYNRNTGQKGPIGISTLATTVTTTITRFNLPSINEYADFGSNDAIQADLCITNNGGSTPYTFYFGNGTTPSGFNITVNGIDNTSTQTIEYHGGGEIHVSAPQGVPSDIWAYTNRTLTSTAVDYNTIANTVWNATNRTLTTVENYTIEIQQIWNYTNRTLTSTAVDYNAVAGAVWNYTNRNLTYYAPADYVQIAAYIWNYTTGRYVNGVIN